jgi:hypothetical protein
VLGVPFLPIIGTSSNPPAAWPGEKPSSHQPLLVRGSRSVLSLSGQNVFRKDLRSTSLSAARRPPLISICAVQ